MKKFVCLIVFMFLCLPFVLADTTTQTSSTAQQQEIPLVAYTSCYKSYAKNSEPVFYLVLSAIAKHGYTVEEIQSKNGLILFKVYNKEFFVNVTQIDAQTTLVKITPADNNYRFQYTALENIFQTVASELNNPIYKIN